MDIDKIEKKYTEARASRSAGPEFEFMSETVPLLISEVRRLLEENAEWSQSFDLFYKAVNKADALYREAHPDYPPLSLPSLHKVVDWLIEDRERLRDDEKRLDWLDAHCDGQALISDDCKCWAVSWDGMQNVPDTDYPDSILTTHYINKEDWKHSVRDAIDVAIAEVGEEE